MAYEEMEKWFCFDSAAYDNARSSESSSSIPVAQDSHLPSFSLESTLTPALSGGSYYDTIALEADITEDTASTVACPLNAHFSTSGDGFVSASQASAFPALMACALPTSTQESLVQSKPDIVAGSYAELYSTRGTPAAHDGLIEIPPIGIIPSGRRPGRPYINPLPLERVAVDFPFDQGCDRCQLSSSSLCTSVPNAAELWEKGKRKSTKVMGTACDSCSRRKSACSWKKAAARSTSDPVEPLRTSN